MSVGGGWRSAPPRLAAALLARALTPGVASDSILGDLHEEFLDRAAQSAWRAHLWYWGAAARLAFEAIVFRALGACARLPGRAARLIRAVGQDQIVAVRWLRRRPLFAVSAVVSVSIGIGAVTTASGVVDALLFRPQGGVRAPDRMVDVQDRASGQLGRFSYPDVRTLQAGIGSLSALAAVRYDDMAVSWGDGGTQVWGMFVSSNYFEAVGASSGIGRTFAPEEDEDGAGAHRVAVVSDAFWRNRLGGDPGVIGRTIRVNGEAVEIVGVAPPEFRGHFRAIASDLWLPITQMPQVRRDPSILLDRSEVGFNVVGRLAEGRTLDQAQAETDALLSNLAQEFPDAYTERDAGIRLVPYSPLPRGRGSRPLVILAAALMVLVGLVLVVTASNVAGMLLARSATQSRQIALRMALGASRSRLVLYSLSETLVLFVVGGLGGILVAWLGTASLDIASLPLPVTVSLDLALDGRVMVVGLAIALCTGLLFGVGPALWSTRRGISPLLAERHGGSSRLRMRGLFVSGQVTTALVLAAAGLIFLRSARRADAIPRGFEADGRYTVSVDLGVGDDETADGAVRAGLDLVEVLERSNAFHSVALSSDLPLDGGFPTWPIFRIGEGEAPEEERVYRNVVSEDYFRVLQISRASGRLFDDRDRLGTDRAAVVNRSYADRFGGTRSVVGSRFYTTSPEEPIEIVGIVEDVPDGGLRTMGEPMIYLPLPQHALRRVRVTARVRPEDPVPPEALARILREQRPSISLGPVRRLDEIARVATFDQRAGVVVTSVLAIVALLLSGLGLYSVAAFHVSTRHREIGIRMALGSDQKRVARGVLLRSLRLSLPGIICGWLAAAALSRGLGSFLYDVPALDPLVMGGVGAVAMVIVAAASLGPAKRAASTDPAVAVRAD